MFDYFGVYKLFADSSGGRSWHSTWGNGVARSLARSGERDPYDPSGLFELRGSNPHLTIDGRGVARLAGDSPRMYVYDARKVQKWGNVEVTFYARRVSELEEKSSQGLVAGARSEHQDATTEPSCNGLTYYGRMLYDGRVNFQKELVHHLGDDNRGYTAPRPVRGCNPWHTEDGEMPRYIWIGYKLVVRNSADGSAVLLSLYRDMTDGFAGGRWLKMIEESDSGGWRVTSVGDCDHELDKILLQPGTSVFIRNDLIEAADYKKFSVREIIPEG